MSEKKETIIADLNGVTDLYLRNNKDTPAAVSYSHSLRLTCLSSLITLHTKVRDLQEKKKARPLFFPEEDVIGYEVAGH